MNKSSLSAFSTTLALAIVFSNLLIAGEQQYIEPPILHKEIELQRQSQAKSAKEQSAQLEEKRITKENVKTGSARIEEKRVAKENAKTESARMKEQKRVIAEKEKLAIEIEEKRIAAEKEKDKNEEEMSYSQYMLHRMDEYKKGNGRTAISENVNNNTSNAHTDDVAAAKKFLARLPAACSSSHMYTSIDGTVNLRVICNGSNQSMDGLISVKDGVLIDVR